MKDKHNRNESSLGPFGGSNELFLANLEEDGGRISNGRSSKREHGRECPLLLPQEPQEVMRASLETR